MKKTQILLILIFALALFLRFYKLGEVPNGLYQDETAIGYNAFSILQTGKDEYGKSLPLYFKSFGDWKLPVYIYSTIIPVKLFGLNEFSVRFPSAVAGFLAVILFYFYLKLISKDKKLSLMATALLAVNPWHLHYSRATFEVSLCLLFFLCGALLLHLFFEFNKKAYLIPASLFFLLALYSYNLTRLLSPVLFILFLFYYRNKLRENFFYLGLTIFLGLIFLIPFILTIFTGGGISSAGGTLFFSSNAVWAPLLEFRSYLISLPSFFTSLFFNRIILNVWQYLNNLVSYFSVDFFFISGSSHGNHGIGNVGQFYLSEFPLMILGIIYLIKKVKEGQRWPKILFGWTILTIFIASLTREVPHATRSFFLIFPLEVLSAAGLIYFWINFKKWAFLIISLIILNLVFYFGSYYYRFPIFYAKAWRAGDRNVSLYLKDHESKYQKVIFDDSAGFMYTSLLFYLPFSPEEFQRTVMRLPDDSEGFSVVKSFGKYQFKEVDWNNDYKESKKTLIITTPDRKPNDVLPLETFYYPRRPVVFSLKEKIISYPIEEIAYVLVETP